MPNAERPIGGGGGLAGQQQKELTNLTLQFKTFFKNWYKTEKLNSVVRNYNTVVKTSYSSCFEKTKKIPA